LSETTPYLHAQPAIRSGYTRQATNMPINA